MENPLLDAAGREGCSPRYILHLLLKLQSRSLYLANGCRVWLGGTNGVGYGLMCMFGKHDYTHRIAWRLLVGLIPPKKELDHLCRTPLCWNPEHLEPVPPKINKLRGVSPFAKKAAQTHCIHGHVLEGFNLMIRPNGCRKCRTCHYRMVYARRARLLSKNL